MTPQEIITTAKSARGMLPVGDLEMTFSLSNWHLDADELSEMFGFEHRSDNARAVFKAVQDEYEFPDHSWGGGRGTYWETTFELVAIIVDGFESFDRAWIDRNLGPAIVIALEADAASATEGEG